MNTIDFIFALVLSFLLSLVLTPSFGWLAKRFEIVDRPDSERKIHKKTVPLLGGLAIFFSFNVVMLMYALFSDAITGQILWLKNILGICAGTGILALGGFLDDKYNLKARYQIIFPVLAIATVIISGIGIDFVQNPFGEGVIRLDQFQKILFWYDGFPYKMTLFADIFTFIWLLAIIYTTKLLDGLDGLVSGITVIGAFFIFFTALNKMDFAQTDVAVLAMILAGAFLGFLVFNFNPATIFLGEGGSTMAGFLLGVLSIASGSKVGVTLLILSIPVIDLIWTIIRRIMERKSFSTADRKHLHHRLLDAGFTVKQAVLILYSMVLVFGVSAYYLQDWHLTFATAGGFALIVFALLCAYLYRAKKLREKPLT